MAYLYILIGNIGINGILIYTMPTCIHLHVIFSRTHKL